MVTALVDCFYGGTGARLPFNRKEFTHTDERLLQKFSATLIEKLVESWAETHPVDATRVNRETNINYVHVAGPDEKVGRSEERRVGKECVCSGISPCAPDP